MVRVPPKLARRRSGWVENAVSFKARNEQPMYLNVDDFSEDAFIALTEYLKCNSRPIYEMEKEDRNMLVDFFQLKELEQTLSAAEARAHTENMVQKCVHCGSFFTEKTNVLNPTCVRKPPRDTFPPLGNQTPKCTVCMKTIHQCDCLVKSLHVTS